MGTFNPQWVSAPGDSIQDILEEREMSFESFTTGLGISGDEARKLLRGDLPISDQLAAKLGQLFGISAQFWINREKHYRDGLAKGLKSI